MAATDLGNSGAGPGMFALFDLDGTLTDPAEGIVASFAAGLVSVGLDPDDHGDLTRFIGPPLQDSYASLGLDEDRVEAAVAGYRERFAAGGMFENEVYPGIPELLGSLAEAGWTLAVATSKPEKFTHLILRRFELADHFSVVSGATMDGSRRHKYDIVMRALAELGAMPNDRSVMIGDRSVDIAAAHKARIGSIGVVYGYGAPEELIGANPDALAGSPEEIGPLLGLPE